MTEAEDDDGFTLVELLLSAAILSVIMAAITGALIVFFSNAAYTTQRDDHSAGAAIVASYLDRDLASAEAATESAASAPCSAGTKDLLLEWNERTASPGDVTPRPGQDFSAAYALVDDGAGRFELARWYCKGTTVVDQAVLLRSLASGDFDALPDAACGGPSTSIVIGLKAYSDDVGGSDYTYSGCLKGRLS